MALHEAQRQPGASASSHQAGSTLSAVHSPPADANDGAQQQHSSTAEQLHSSPPQQQQAPKPGASPPAESVTLPQRVGTQNAEANHSSQQEGTVQQQQAKLSGVSTPTGPSLPGSMTKQDPQQQLLQQLAAQAGFQLVSPPSQSAGGVAAHAGGMHQADQNTPVQAPLPHQHEWPAAYGHAGVSQGLGPELGHHGLLQQLGQDLQSSAMQIASMQQQQVQQQSRLPAWAQQALMPDPTPPMPASTTFYGTLGANLAHSMHALHASPAHSMPGQYASAAHMHEQYNSSGLRASQTGGSWNQPPWQQQQQQPQQWGLHDYPTQQYSNMTPVRNLAHIAVQGFGVYSSSPLDSSSSPAAASWLFNHGGVDTGTPATPQGRQASPMDQSQAGDTAALHSHGRGPSQQGSWSGSLPDVVHDKHLGMGKEPPVSVLEPYQAETGLPLVLSGGSSGVSSPVRESGHLESLLEVNNRFEAAMGRARAQLQVSLHSACNRWINISGRIMTRQAQRC